MVVRVIGCPSVIEDERSRRHVLVKNNNGTLLVDCDIDVVSLGLSLKLIERIYREYLETLQPDTAAMIKSTIEEVANEQY